MIRGGPEQAIVGRDAELAAVERLLDSSLGVQVLVVEGEPGIGKTTLWQEAVRHAEAAGRRVLSSRPAQTEAKLSYVGLGDLLDPLPGRIFESLPQVQREALDLALLRSETGRAEPLAVAAATRAALVAAAREQPVLIAIDDAQWLDAASAAAIGYALRRIAGEPVSVVVCTRPAPPGRRSRFELPDGEVLRLGQLSVAAVHDVLKARLQLSLPRPLITRVHEACKGNPFYAIEIARELASTPVEPGQPVPVPANLRQVVRRRMARLSPMAREALLVAAAAREPSRALLARVLGADPGPALDEAEDADVITLSGEVIRFAHPLYAAAIYAATPRSTRARAHMILADVAPDGEERVRHLALAAEGPSADVAAELEQTAEEVRRRGAALPAAALLSEAARLTPPGQEAFRQRRELAAAQAFFDGADSDSARLILERLVQTMPRGVDRARAQLLMGLIHSYDGEHKAATSACLEAIEDAAGDSRLLAEAHIRFALVYYGDAGESRQSCAAARALVEQDPAAPADLVAAALLDDAYQGLYVGEGLAAEQVERALTLLPRHGRTWLAQRAQVAAYLYAKYTDDLVRARELLHQVIELRRDEGHDYEAALTLRHLAEVECWLGNWQRASEIAADADEAATHRAVSLYLRSLVHAHLGDVVQAREWGEEGLTLSEDNAWYRALNLSALGFLELSLGDADAAAGRLDAAAAEVASMEMTEPARFRFDGDHVEALVTAGRLADAKGRVADLARRVAQTPRPWTRVMRARGEALVAAATGDTEGAATAIETAVAEHERLSMPFEYARTLLVKGEIERRAKRRGVAKTSLEEALAEFERLGAPLWAERARRELDRTGLRRAPDDLTPSERRVAELAAAGLTNREVAARLFMSPKTVEANLGRVYRKLGIRSRAELGARFGEGSARPQT